MSVGAVNKNTGDRIPTAGMPAIDDALDLTSVNPVQNAIITAALAGKQNALTAGSHIAIDDDTISVNRWAVPAGKVVYTVITSDENYGQNVHVQRYTISGSFIDDRVYTIRTWENVTVDGLIYIEDRYTKFYITLLKDSDEQSAGYQYIVNPNTTPTSNSFTFMMEQEENDNDLIIREELDAVSDAVDAIKDGTDIDSFADVETALALKQDATDNSLQTTNKTVVGGINELKSGLTNLTDDVKLNTQDLTTPSRTKNLLPLTVEKIKSSNTSGTWNNNEYTVGGCVFTVNTNAQGQVISIDVSNANTTTYVSALNIPLPKNNNKYKFCGGGSDSYDVLLWDNTTNARAKKWDGSTNSESSTNVTVLREVLNVARDNIELRCRVNANTPAGSATYYPLLVGENETDPTFAPYIPSVDARLDAVESGLTNLTDVVGWGVDGGNVLIPSSGGSKNGVSYTRVYDKLGYVTKYDLSNATTSANTAILPYRLPVKATSADYKVKYFNLPDGAGYMLWDDTTSSSISYGSGIITVPANHEVYIGIFITDSGTDMSGKYLQVMSTENTSDPMATYYPTRPVIGSAVADMESRLDAVESGLTNVSTVLVPPNASNKITLVRGGYVKLGRMVLVSVIVTATDDITSPNTAILWGFPSVGTVNQPLIIIEDGENTIKTNAATRMYENTLYCGLALENGKTYVISGVYNSIA